MTIMSSHSIIWAFNTLRDFGYTIQNPTPEVILQTPWSCVYRFDTDQGSLYLKQIPPGLSREPQVIHLLRETCAASVPVLIADNPHLHCFLMQNAGIPLREFFKQGFNAKLLTTVIHDYIAVQRKSMTHLNRFLNLSVSDRRIQKIPECYTTLIQQEKLLIADGLTNSELKQLTKLIPKLTELCEQLSQYPFSDTFSHNDFHDNNLLIDLKTQTVTLVDLGEVAITHPFFSLLNMLHQIKKNSLLPENSYQHLEQQSLQPWLDYGSQTQLLAAMALIQQCWPIHRALTVYHCLTSIEASAAQQLVGQGRLAKNLRIWLDQ